MYGPLPYLPTYLVISSNINLLFLKSFLWCYSTIDVHWLHFNTLELWPLYVLFELFLLWNVQNIVVLSTLLCIDVYLVHSRGFDIKIAKKTKVRYLGSSTSIHMYSSSNLISLSQNGFIQLLMLGTYLKSKIQHAF